MKSASIHMRLRRNKYTEVHALPPEQGSKGKEVYSFFPLQKKEKRLQDLLWIQSERKGKKPKNPNTCKQEAQEKYAKLGK